MLQSSPFWMFVVVLATTMTLSACSMYLVKLKSLKQFNKLLLEFRKTLFENLYFFFLKYTGTFFWIWWLYNKIKHAISRVIPTTASYINKSNNSLYKNLVKNWPQPQAYLETSLMQFFCEKQLLAIKNFCK